VEEDHLLRCFCRSTGEFSLLVDSSPYLYPFIVEYLMLVMECVADWFFSDANKHHHQHHHHRGDGDAAAAGPEHTVTAPATMQLHSVTSFEDEQLQPLHISSVSMSY